MEKENLVKNNMGLVVSVAKKYLNHGVEFEDLVQEGVIGFLRALRTHNPKKGKLSTYALPWIKKGIREAVLKKGLIHVPYKRQLMSNKLDRENRIKYAKTGEKRENKNNKPAYIADYKCILKREIDIERCMDARKKIRIFYQAFHELPNDKKEMLSLLFNIQDHKSVSRNGETLDSVGKRFGLTRERVRQIVQGFLEDVKKKWRRNEKRVR